jgi:hypothetical protein
MGFGYSVPPLSELVDQKTKYLFPLWQEIVAIDVGWVQHSDIMKFQI